MNLNKFQKALYAFKCTIILLSISTNALNAVELKKETSSTSILHDPIYYYLFFAGIFAIAIVMFSYLKNKEINKEKKRRGNLVKRYGNFASRHYKH